MAKQTFGAYLRMVLDQKSMRGNRLAKASGVAEGTIRNVLKQGEDSSFSSPHPLVLRTVSEILRLDMVRVLQMLDYVPADDQARELSPIGEYIGLSFDQLSEDKQRVLLGVMATLTGDSGFSPDDINRLSQAVRDLRKTHPMFIERKFDMPDEVGRFVGSAFGLLSDTYVVPSTTRRLEALFKDEPITEEQVRAAVTNPRGRIVLNLLLPRKEIPNPLEKLYWLMFPNDTYGKQEQDISPEQQEGIRALRLILAHV